MQYASQCSTLNRVKPMTNKLSAAASILLDVPLSCVIMAAGHGTRMQSALPKVLHQVAGRAIIAHIVAACQALAPEALVAVIAPDAPAVIAAAAPAHCVVQDYPRGSADSVKTAHKVLAGCTGDLLVVYGDTPLLTPQTLNLLREKRRETNATIVVAGFIPDDPSPYGRLITDEEDRLEAIVEARDATPAQSEIALCNGGIMLFDAEKIWQLLDEVRPNNAAKELYLTDCIALARQHGWECAMVELPPEDLLGVNNRVDLALTESIMQDRLRAKAMMGGATLSDPATVYLSADTKIGRDVTIAQNVVIGSGVEIADGVTIRAFCHLEGVKIERGAIVGPFARLRPGSVIGEDAHIGNFVETKNTIVGNGTKINHLSYIGDSDVGEKANIGAGTITCNYDGFRKSRTRIGDGAFIGSNTALVAPVIVGDGAYVGAGSVITMDIPPHTLAVARSRQANIEDGAKRFREQKKPKD